MCGIYSALSPLEFHNLYKHNQSRGGHSSGFLYISEDGFEIVKTTNTNYSYFPDISNGFYLGHNRAPTTSGDTKGLSSCHPFIYGRAIAAHNGIISNTEDLKKKHNVDFDVDSQWIPYLYDHYLKSHMNFSAEAAFRYAIQDLKGTYGIWLYDIDKQIIFVTRGDNTIYWDKNKINFSSITDETHNQLMPEGAIYSKHIKDKTFTDINEDRRLKRDQKYFMI